MVRNEDQSIPNANKLLSLTSDESADHKTNTQAATQAPARKKGDGHIEYTTRMSTKPIKNDKYAKNLNPTLMLNELVNKKETSDDLTKHTPQKIEYPEGGDEIVYVVGENDTNNDLPVTDVDDDANNSKLQASDEDDSDMSAMYDQIETKGD